MQLKQQSKIFCIRVSSSFPIQSHFVSGNHSFLIKVVFVLSVVSFFVTCPNGT